MQQREEVFAKLASVNDPELDRSLTDLNFINEVTINGHTVKVSFRLPTYWCSTNFAYIMAEDIRDRVSELPWVSSIEVSLEDHCNSDEINAGVNTRKSFSETFPETATGDLNELRKIFRLKAFLSRQEKMLQHLIHLGAEPSAILHLTLRDLTDLVSCKSEGKALLDWYLAIRKELGHSNEPQSAAFIQADGKKLELADFPEYLACARRTRLSMEFNGHYCQGLFQTRYHNISTDLEECTHESSAFISLQ